MHKFSIWYSHEIPSFRYAISIFRVIKIHSINKLKYILQGFISTPHALYEYHGIDMLIKKHISNVLNPRTNY